MLIEEVRQAMNLQQEGRKEEEQKGQEAKWHIEEGELTRTPTRAKGKQKGQKRTTTQKGPKLGAIVEDHGELYTGAGQLRVFETKADGTVVDQFGNKAPTRQPPDPVTQNKITIVRPQKKQTKEETPLPRVKMEAIKEKSPATGGLQPKGGREPPELFRRPLSQQRPSKDRRRDSRYSASRQTPQADQH